MCDSIKYLNKTKNDIFDDYGHKYLKIRINFNYDLPVAKTLVMHYIVILIRSTFNDENRC